MRARPDGIVSEAVRPELAGPYRLTSGAPLSRPGWIGRPSKALILPDADRLRGWDWIHVVAGIVLLLAAALAAWQLAGG